MSRPFQPLRSGPVLTSAQTVVVRSCASVGVRDPVCGLAPRQDARAEERPANLPGHRWETRVCRAGTERGTGTLDSAAGESPGVARGECIEWDPDGRRSKDASPGLPACPAEESRRRRLPSGGGGGPAGVRGRCSRPNLPRTCVAFRPWVVSPLRVRLGAVMRSRSADRRTGDGSPGRAVGSRRQFVPTDVANPPEGNQAPTRRWRAPPSPVTAAQSEGGRNLLDGVERAQRVGILDVVRPGES